MRLCDRIFRALPLHKAHLDELRMIFWLSNPTLFHAGHQRLPDRAKHISTWWKGNRFNGACAHSGLMVSKVQWRPFWLATQLYPQKEWTGWQFRVSYGIYSHSSYSFGELSSKLLRPSELRMTWLPLTTGKKMALGSQTRSCETRLLVALFITRPQPQ